MKQLLLCSSFIFFCFHFSYSQNVGIGTLTPAEKLDINGNSRVSGYIRAQSISLHNTTSFIPSTNAILDIVSNNKGILIPRLTMVQRNSIANPEWGLLIFQYDNNPGFYYNKGNGTPDWIKVGAENSSKGFTQLTTAGTSNFIVPQGVSSIEFEAMSSGGGGGGGQIYNGTHCGIGGGGGGGAYFSGLLKVNPGDNLTITVGAAGIAGTTNTTPVAGTAGTDAANTTLLVNGNMAFDLSGGKGGTGGISDGTSNIGLGVNGGNGGLLLIQFISYVNAYNSGGGSMGGIGGSWITGQAALQWGGSGIVMAYPQYSLPDASFRPVNGQGGKGGNNSIPASNGILGYVKLKY